VCLANQVGGEEAAEKPSLEERRCTSEANEKMILEPLDYSSDTPYKQTPKKPIFGQTHGM
jgi:hypothetical protein